MASKQRNLKVGYIVSYPPTVETEDHVERAMAWYMQRMLSAMPKEGFHYQVYANLIDGEPKYTSVGEHIEIIRCWERKPSFIYKIIRAISQNPPDIIHFQYELFEFGAGISTFLVPILLLFIRLWGIPVVTGTASLPKLTTINQDLLKIYGLEYMPVSVIRFVLRFLIRSAAALSKVVVVAQTGGETFAETLVNEYGIRREKIVLTPMPSEERDDKINKSEARSLLNISEDTKMLLFFGFIAGYKGLELLIDAFDVLARRYSDMQLYIAGGDTPGLKTNDEISYLDSLKRRAEATGAPIHFTGYVLDQDIKLYYSAADLLILPYIAGLSSSGPLVISTAYDCPFIASTALARVVGLRSALFEPDLNALVLKVEEFFSDQNFRHEVQEYIKEFKSGYSWAQLSNDTVAIYQNLP